MSAPTIGTATPWWQSAVVYQIYPRSFADSGGDGIGDLRGILGRLDHLSDLGVDAVWLSPIYPSPQVDNGYDISDYQAVDPVFGTLADLDELIAALHARDMRLILDIVVNHTSDQHPWFVEARSSPSSDKRDWYWWRPGRDGGGPPNNWGSLFSGPAWTWDEVSGEYYLHTFAVEQPDLNWENPAVRAAVQQMMRWWLDRGVDGFRLDVISMIAKDVALADGIVAAGQTYAPPSMGFAPQLHAHLQELHQQVLAGRDVVTVGETPGITVEVARRMTDARRREVDMVFEFEHVGLDHGASKWEVQSVPLPVLKACFAKWQNGLAAHGWNSLYWNNHDQPRVVSRFGDDGEHRVASATTLATVLHLHRGTPFVYQGEELGMTNAGFTELAHYRDLESLNMAADQAARGHSPDSVLEALAVSSRDNARTPMQWDAGPAAGFTTGTPWIDVNRNHVEINAAQQRHDPHSVLAHYRRLIALRHEEPVVAQGDFTLLLPDHEQVWAFTRSLGDVQLLMVANLSAGSVTVGLDWPVDTAERLLTNLPCNDAQQQTGTQLTLRAWESRVYRRKDV